MPRAGSGLPPKQEKFAQEVASGKTQADAYRAAYNAGKMKASSIQECASRLMADLKVSARVDALRKPIVEKAQLTLESHLARLEELSTAAADSRQFSASIAAEVARGKAIGLYVEKHHHSGPGGAPIDMNLNLNFVKPK